jgi:threonine dehydratase
MVEAPSIEDVRAARERIAPWAVRTPLLPLAADDAPAEIGSFKIRGAGNAMALADPARLVRGVYTASAGNMAQGVAWHARRLGVPCTAVVPESAPGAKLAAVTRLGATFVKVPFDAWWQVMIDRRFEPLADRFFVHPFAERSVMAGNGTIGLEIVEDLPDVDTVVVPYGGGGLSVGIAAAIKSIKPDVRVFASEVDTGAPVAASFAAGRPTPVEYEPSFVDGIGSKAVLEPMWLLVREFLDGSVTCSVAEAAAAVRLLAVRNRVVAEGAGAAPVAAALAGRAGGGKVVAVVSGGNIDAAKLAAILTGAIP